MQKIKPGFIYAKNKDIMYNEVIYSAEIAHKAVDFLAKDHLLYSILELSNPNVKKIYLEKGEDINNFIKNFGLYMNLYSVNPDNFSEEAPADLKLINTMVSLTDKIDNLYQDSEKGSNFRQRWDYLTEHNKDIVESLKTYLPKEISNNN